MISQFFCNLNSSKNFICPSGKLRAKFTSPIAKSTCPGLSDTTFFARCFRFSWHGKDRFLYISGDNRWADIDHNKTHAWQVRMHFKQSKKNALYHCFVFFFLFSFDSFFLLVATKGWGLTESTVSFPLHSSFIGYSSCHTFMSSPSVSNRTVLVTATKKRNIEISLDKATYQTDSLR